MNNGIVCYDEIFTVISFNGWQLYNIAKHKVFFIIIVNEFFQGKGSFVISVLDFFYIQRVSHKVIFYFEV